MNAAVTQLGYVGVNATDSQAWRRLGEHLGADVTAGPDGGVVYRIDSDRWSRFAVHPAEKDGLAYVGWEAPDRAAFRLILDQLRRLGTEVELREDLASLRGAEEVATFADPDGNPGELYWGMASAVRTQFVSPHGVDFSVGDMGMGHLTIGVADFARTLDFYSEGLGLTLTEIADVGAGRVGFMRCNSRHHSLAFAQIPGGKSMVGHIAIEVEHLDALGSIRDRLMDDGITISRDLGRHPTDGVISMYLAINGVFDIELGWGSIVVDDETWNRDRYQRIGWSWGHRTGTNSAPSPKLGETAPDGN